MKDGREIVNELSSTADNQCWEGSTINTGSPAAVS